MLVNYFTRLAAIRGIKTYIAIHAGKLLEKVFELKCLKIEIYVLNLLQS